MARWDLTDDEVEAVLQGTAVDGVAPGLHDLVHQLRHAPSALPAVPPSATLAEFLAVADLAPVSELPPTPEETTIMTKLSRRLATTTGRAVVIAAVVLGTAGAAQAKGVVDVRALAGHGSTPINASAAAAGHDARGTSGDDHDRDDDTDADHAHGGKAGRADDTQGSTTTRVTAADHGQDDDGQAPGARPAPCEHPLPAEASPTAVEHANGGQACHRPVNPGAPSTTVPSRPTVTLSVPTITICDRPPITIEPPRAANEANGPVTVKTLPCPVSVSLPPVTVPSGGGNPGPTTGHSTTIVAPGPPATR